MIKIGELARETETGKIVEVRKIEGDNVLVVGIGNRKERKHRTVSIDNLEPVILDEIGNILN